MALCKIEQSKTENIRELICHLFIFLTPFASIFTSFTLSLSLSLSLLFCFFYLSTFCACKIADTCLHTHTHTRQWNLSLIHTKNANALLPCFDFGIHIPLAIITPPFLHLALPVCVCFGAFSLSLPCSAHYIPAAAAAYPAKAALLACPVYVLLLML